MRADTRLPPYLPYPRFLLQADLTQTAKLLYALLLDRATLSQANGWLDEGGRIYLAFPIKYTTKDERVRLHGIFEGEKLQAAGMIPLCLPPYSPDLNPIEMMWSKMKAILRRFGCSIAALLPQMVANALALVSPADCIGWFFADGY